MIYKSLLTKPCFLTNPEVILTMNKFCDTTGIKSFRIQVHLSPADDYDIELAYFNIYGNYIRAPFEKLSRLKNRLQFSPPSMNINCENYQGHHVSKMLILIAFYFAKQEYSRFNDYSELFIDTDASTVVGNDTSGNKVTYWSAIGMTSNEIENAVSAGYEKRCIVRDLHPYLFR
jgi:hypothetical protein